MQSETSQTERETYERTSSLAVHHCIGCFRLGYYMGGDQWGSARKELVDIHPIDMRSSKPTKGFRAQIVSSIGKVTQYEIIAIENRDNAGSFGRRGKVRHAETCIM